MEKATRTLAFMFASLFALSACGSDPVEELAGTEISTDTESVTELVSEGAEPVEADTSDDVSTDDTIADDSETTNDTDTEDDSETTDEEVEETCDAPELQAHFVDVALDDPDGGLNVRSGAGTDNEVIITIPRSGELIPSGNCSVVGTVDWWEVSTSDGSLTGWASSRFLSDLPVFNPGLGKAIADTDNEGLSTETLEEMLEIIADSYGFDEDRTITQIGDLIGADAQGGEGTWEITGLKDDASNGYQVEISFLFDKDDNAENIIGFTAARITNYALCTRGVTEDGLCT